MRSADVGEGGGADGGVVGEGREGVFGREIGGVVDFVEDSEEGGTFGAALAAGGGGGEDGGGRLGGEEGGFFGHGGGGRGERSRGTWGV